MKFWRKNIKRLSFIFIFLLLIIASFLSVFFLPKKLGYKSQAKEVQAPAFVQSVNMQLGEQLKDQIIRRKNYKVGKQSLEPKMKIVKQKIGVKFGVALQVIINHCNDYVKDGVRDDRYTQWPAGDYSNWSAEDIKKIKPCLYVENKIKFDFDQLQRDFLGTGKDFFYDGIDETWDQSKIQPGNCGSASGGQQLSELSCHYMEKYDKKQYDGSIYVSIIYARLAQSSGGEAYDTNSIAYTAPNILNSYDYWDKGTGYFYNTYYVISHEIGHLFGQEHTLYVIGQDNYARSGIYLAPKYVGSLSKYESEYTQFSGTKPSFDWAFRTTQYCHLGEFYRMEGDVPTNIRLNFNGLDSNKNHKLKIYGTFQNDEEGYRYGQQIINKEPLYGEINLGKEAYFQIDRDTIVKNLILFFVITQDDKEFYYWYSIMDANFAFWEDKNTATLTPLKINMYHVDIDIDVRRADGSFMVIYMTDSTFKSRNEGRFVINDIKRNAVATYKVDTSERYIRVKLFDKNGSVIDNGKLKNCSGKIHEKYNWVCIIDDKSYNQIKFEF